MFDEKSLPLVPIVTKLPKVRHPGVVPPPSPLTSPRGLTFVRYSCGGISFAMAHQMVSARTALFACVMLKLALPSTAQDAVYSIKGSGTTNPSKLFW